MFNLFDESPRGYNRLTVALLLIAISAVLVSFLYGQFMLQ